ncbi:hypothetical protein GOP47_0004854 [Adiantum capillus-veneris]|uniref:BHLH domain-containing protein n=1 Tax=Adiantum capillus-veneris TaxID=13818 RepID=A0A9D4ZNL3_ADICA|nr:hypothetical protein GOP47_0004854 [Adiantum capillus-veneris]
MEPSSNHPACRTPFPFFELHQVAADDAGDIMATSTPSAMDILCDIVNSEYSHTSYTTAPPAVVSSSSQHTAHRLKNEKESFLDILLYSSGSKAMETVNHNEMQMINQQHPPPYNILIPDVSDLNSMPVTSSTQLAFSSSPDMHHHNFKLPLLEQEPETSITNSQVDETFKHKEIRRNLERSMQQFTGPRQPSYYSSETLVLSQAGEGRVDSDHRLNEVSSCSSPMRFYDYDTPMVDKVQSSSSAKPCILNEDEDIVNMKWDAKGAFEARSSVKPHIDEEHKPLMKTRKVGARHNIIVENSSHCSKKSDKTSYNSIARLKQGGSTDKSTRANLNITTHSSSSNLLKLAAGQSQYDRSKRLHVEGSGARVGRSLVGAGPIREPLAEGSLGEKGQKRARVDSPEAAGAYNIVEEPSTATPAAASEQGLASNRNTTHISVERNRRKQMNEHLAILRSLMPASYVQRNDQASIIGGVVEFLKELQQLLNSLETQKRRRAYVAEAISPRVSGESGGPSPRGSIVHQHSPRGTTQELVATSRSPLADVEVKLAGGAHVILRTLSHKSTRGQLLHLIAALECMNLEILHLNITTLQQSVLYTFTLKIGIECRLSVDDLADVGQQIFKDIHARKL